MDEAFPLPSDHALMVAARDGSDAAWSELRSRHEAAVVAVAGVPNSTTARTAAGGGQRAVAAAFQRLHDRVLRADGAVTDDGGEAVRAVRPMAIAALTNGTYGPAPTGADTETSNAAATANELATIAAAFACVPEAWQTVLWHRWVEQAPAAQLTSLLGRSSADVIALEHTAGRGLFDVANVVALGATPSPPPMCRPIISLLGAYRRGTLPEAQRRTVDAHLAGPGRLDEAPVSTADSPGCAACRRRLELADRFGDVVPTAVVPGVTGLTPQQYRAAIGTGGAAIGVAALSARQSARAGRWARAGAAAAVVMALVAAALVIRAPLRQLPNLAELLDRAATPTTAPHAETTVPSDAVGSSADPSAPSIIELVFPSAPQGAVYVPGSSLDLSIALSTPAPFFAGATGTVDAVLTNNDTEAASVPYLVRVSHAIRFEQLTEGDGSCRAADDGGATCVVEIDAGGAVSMSLRFAVDADSPHRLVVDTNLSPRSLEVPIETVPGLLVGETTRGRTVTVGGVLGSCAISYGCRDGTSVASSAVLDLVPDTEIQRAFIVWEGETPRAGAPAIELLTPAGGDTQTVVSQPAGLAVVSDGVSSSRFVGDITDLVRTAGSGEYTVIGPPTADVVADAQSDGWWRLVTVTAEPGGPRRLLVVILPDAPVTASAPFELDVPVAGSATPAEVTPPTRRLTVEVVAGAEVAEPGVQELAIDGAAVGGLDPVGPAADDAAARSVRSYDLEIASTEDALSLFATTVTGSIRLAVVAMALDIVT